MKEIKRGGRSRHKSGASKKPLGGYSPEDLPGSLFVVSKQGARRCGRGEGNVTKPSKDNLSLRVSIKDYLIVRSK